ncbi:CorA family magnesium ion transporterr [Perkinsela sp. CCAP 1560/4]|nr:CorA family magnesium ion transporterr [Perkinsela sp. CCAP 1560/4]|eukprot:KNH06286.1 CorA family magnesium ion transporterr [Perkinsela sp. CCAP 1560/4]
MYSPKKELLQNRPIESDAENQSPTHSFKDSSPEKSFKIDFSSKEHETQSRMSDDHNSSNDDIGYRSMIWNKEQAKTIKRYKKRRSHGRTISRDQHRSKQNSSEQKVSRERRSKSICVLSRLANTPYIRQRILHSVVEAVAELQELVAQSKKIKEITLKEKLGARLGSATATNLPLDGPNAVLSPLSLTSSPRREEMNESDSSSMESIETITPVSYVPMLGKYEALWFNLEGISHDDLQKISNVCELNTLTVEDLITGDTPDKVEFTGDYFFCSLSYSTPGGWLARIGLVLTESFVLTLHQDSSMIIQEAVSRLQLMQVTLLTAEHIFYTILDIVVDSMVHKVRHFQYEVDDLDELALTITESESGSFLRKLTRTRRKVTNFRSNLTLKHTIARTVLSQQYSECFFLRRYYHDVLDNITQAQSRMEMARDMISQVNSNIISVLSMHSAESANLTNEVVKKITMFGGIMLPLNFITSAFGMNVRVPFQDKRDTSVFWGILLALFCFALFLTVLYFLSEWLNTRIRKQKKSKQFADDFDET